MRTVNPDRCGLNRKSMIGKFSVGREKRRKKTHVLDCDGECGQIVSLVHGDGVAADPALVHSKYKMNLVTHNPELRPPASGPQGLANEDWVTV